MQYTKDVTDWTFVVKLTLFCTSRDHVTSLGRAISAWFEASLLRSIIKVVNLRFSCIHKHVMRPGSES